MKKFQLINLNSLFVVGLIAMIGCGGMEEDQSVEEADDALCANWPDCIIDRDPPPPPPARPDLVAEIASGFPDGYACPTGNGNTVTVRVRNQGAASAGQFVVRTEVTLYTGIQYYTYKRHFLVSSLGTGAVTTLGVNLGDGVNAAPGSNGRTTPIVSQQFFNSVGSGWGSGAYVTQWRVLVDTSMGATWYGSGSTAQLISYPNNAVTESNESNNIISGTSNSCTYPSGLVLTQG